MENRHRRATRIRTLVAVLSFALALLAGLAPCPVLAGDDDDDDDGGRKMWSLGARAGPWFAVFDGSLRHRVTLSAGPFGATEGTLSTSLDDGEVLPFGEVFLTARFVSLYADAWYGEFEDETRAEGDFSFAGTTFSASAPLEAELDVLTASGRIQLNPLAIDLLELGISVGARYVGGTGRIEGSDPTTGAVARASRSFDIAYPLAGLSLTVFVSEYADVYVRARGVDLRYEDFQVTDLEGEVGFAINLGDHVSLGAEYRLLYFSVDDERDLDRFGAPQTEVVARIHGPLVFLRLRF